MNNEIFMVVLLTMIFFTFLYIFDEGFLLIMFGIVSAVVGLKFVSLFPLLVDTDLIFMFRLIFGLIAIFAIGKAIYTRHDVLESK